MKKSLIVLGYLMFKTKNGTSPFEFEITKNSIEEVNEVVDKVLSEENLYDGCVFRCKTETTIEVDGEEYVNTKLTLHTFGSLSDEVIQEYEEKLINY